MIFGAINGAIAGFFGLEVMRSVMVSQDASWVAGRRFGRSAQPWARHLTGLIAIQQSS
jgi:hypothetical protein